MSSEYMAANLIKNKLELTIYPKRNQIYLKKKFKQSLGHDIEINIDSEDPRSLLIKEKDSDAPKRCYFDAKLVRELIGNIHANDKLNFLVLKDGLDEKLWRGTLLPAIGTDSYLWGRHKRYDYLFDYGRYKNIIIKALSNESKGLLEKEEVVEFFNIGYFITFSEQKYYGDMFWYHVMMLAYNMINEMKSVVRRSKRAEVEVSLDNVSAVNAFQAYSCMRSAEDECLKYLIVEDFTSRLTLIEQSVLKLRYRDIDWFSCNDIGHGLKILMKETIERLKTKAADYFGIDYIYDMYPLYWPPSKARIFICVIHMSISSDV